MGRDPGKHPGATTSLRDSLRSYLLPALLTTAALIPTSASVFTVIVYVIWQDRFALLIGSGAACVLWLLLALFCHRLLTVERANIRTYGDFRNRLDLLDKRLGPCGSPTEGEHNWTWAFWSRWWGSQQHKPQPEEARACRVSIGRELEEKDSRWIRGYGYNNLWVALHGAEEALIKGGMATDVAVEEGLRDESRLLDSEIPLKKELLVRLRNAICTLSDSARQYFLEPFTCPAGRPAADQERSKKEALGALSEVRHAINEFTDGRYQALARTRNTYLDILPIMGLAVHLILAIAILAEVPKEQIWAGAVFYLLGVIAGLLYRWYKEVGAEKTIQDFGLATVNLFRPVILSGVVALIAVPLVSLTQGLDLTTSVESTATPTPSPTATASAVTPTPSLTATAAESTAIPVPLALAVGRADPLPALRAVAQDGQTNDRSCPEEPSCSDEDVPSLRCIFSLQDDMWGLLVALIFGATPEVLFTLLKASGEKHINALKSTSPGEGIPSA
jgi:hypothetical protein